VYTTPIGGGRDMTFAPDELTPQRVVEELDKYIVGQHAAKRSVANALRNRWRRQQIDSDLQQEIMPNNIILIGLPEWGRLRSPEGCPGWQTLLSSRWKPPSLPRWDMWAGCGIDGERADEQRCQSDPSSDAGKCATGGLRAALNRVLDLLVPVANSEKDPSRGQKSPYP
jgi:hypothetical protein